MKFLRIIRSAEWWEYKLPPLLAIGYATALNSDAPLTATLPHLLFLLLSLIVGAIYVSIINDVTDIKVDAASNKKNRMAAVNPAIRWIFPAISLFAGGLCAYHLYPDQLSVVLYLIPWISFSLYSIPPVRLKNRGIWGVFADACGSHVFTSLLMISSISFVTQQNIDWLWFISTGIWALCYGMRGILWHQFYDRKNDIQANMNTYAVKIEPEDFRKKEILIFLTEILAIVTMLFAIQQILAVAFLLLYLLVAFSRSKRLFYNPVLIIAPEGKPYHILMADFYQVFLPLSLLITAAATQPYAWIILIVHFILFPQKTLTALKDLKPLFLSAK